MGTRPICVVLMLAMAGLPGCSGGGSDDDDDDDDDDVTAVDAAVGADAAADGYVSLIEAPWSLPAGEEDYYCARVTVREESYIRGFRPRAPLGTHHTALSLDTEGGADGVFPCDVSAVGFQLLFGSGVGTAPFELPEGVAYKVPAGQQLLLNLHLYNVSERELAGVSGVDVLLAPADDVVHEAETVYVGTGDLAITPGVVTQTGRCTVPADTTVFGVFPHMHQLGTHMLGAIYAADDDGEPVAVFHDADYAFEEQLNHAVAPAVEISAGSVIHADCTYDNPGPATVGFSDSSDGEMCVLGLYQYPARGGGSVCFE